MPASVNKIIRYNGDLYAGTLDGLYQWNGSTWIQMNLVSSTSAVITDMEVYQGELYVGGYFESVGGISTNGIAKWNGSSWSTLGSGLGQYELMDVMEVYNNELYIGGIFTSLNGVSAGGFAKWNGTTASAVGTGVPPTVIGLPNRISALRVIGSNLFVGGYFNEIDGLPANNIAKYSGGAFSTLGSGVNNSVYEMVNFNGDLIVGGVFTTAGGNQANNIAKWTDVANIDEETIHFEVFPNPSSDEFHVSCKSGTIQSLNIFDVLGNLIWTKSLNGASEISISLNEFSKGSYFLEMYEPSGNITRKKLLKSLVSDITF